MHFFRGKLQKRVKNGESDIRKIASCIGGDPTTRKGVVLAKSNEAKKQGVKTGEPLSFSLRKCPNLQIFKPDFKLYSSCPKAFKNICKFYSPTMEEFSIDECFLDMTGIVSDFKGLIRTAYEIKDRIKNELGFTVIDNLRKKYGFSVIKRGGGMNLGLEVGGKFKGKLG